MISWPSVIRGLRWERHKESKQLGEWDSFLENVLYYIWCIIRAAKEQKKSTKTAKKPAQPAKSTKTAPKQKATKNVQKAAPRVGGKR